MKKIVEMQRGKGAHTETWHIQVEVPDGNPQMIVDGKLVPVRKHPDDDAAEARALAEEHAYPTAASMPDHTNGEGWTFARVLDRFPYENDADAAWAITAGADFHGSPLLDHPLVQAHLLRRGIQPETLR